MISINCLKAIVELGRPDAEKYPVCKRVWESPYWEIFELYRSTLILFLPITIMIFAYSKICKELWFMSNSRRHLNASENYNGNSSNSKR